MIGTETKHLAGTLGQAKNRGSRIKRNKKEKKKNLNTQGNKVMYKILNFDET